MTKHSSDKQEAVATEEDVPGTVKLNVWGEDISDDFWVRVWVADGGEIVIGSGNGQRGFFVGMTDSDAVALASALNRAARTQARRVLALLEGGE